MAYTKIDSKISFSYKLEDLFKSSCILSAYSTKDMTTKEGVNIGEQFALSGDDRPLFNILVKTAMSEVFEPFFKLSAGVDDALAFTADSTVIRVKDNSAYNANTLPLLDIAINDCIVARCLVGWYESCQQPDLYQVSITKYILKQEAISRILFNLTKVGVSSA